MDNRNKQTSIKQISVNDEYVRMFIIFQMTNYFTLFRMAVISKEATTSNADMQVDSGEPLSIVVRNVNISDKNK